MSLFQRGRSRQEEARHRREVRTCYCYCYCYCYNKEARRRREVREALREKNGIMWEKFPFGLPKEIVIVIVTTRTGGRDVVGM